MAIFTGTNGNDILPATGQDNSGDDEFIPLLGNDTVDGGAGIDKLTVDYSSAPGYADISVDASGSLYGNYSAQVGFDRYSVRFQNIEKLIFKSGPPDDYPTKLSIASSSQVIFNGAGNIATFGQSQFENFNAYAITAGDFDDKITTGSGTDGIRSGGGNDTILSGAGEDYIKTGSFPNSGVSSVATVDGGSGFDAWFCDLSDITSGVKLDWNGAKDLIFSNGSSGKNIEAFGALLGNGNDEFSTTGAELELHDGSNTDSDRLTANYSNSAVAMGGNLDLWGTSGFGTTKLLQQDYGVGYIKQQALVFSEFEKINMILSSLGESVSYLARQPVPILVQPLLPGAPPPPAPVFPTVRTAVIDAGGGADTLTFQGFGWAFPSEPGINFKINGSTATDGFTTFINFDSYIIGTSRGSDTIVTGDGNDEVTSETLQFGQNLGNAGGFDSISTGGGNDKIRYGEGKIDAGSGDDFVEQELYGGTGAPSAVDGGSGLDHWFGDIGRGAAFTWDGVSDVTLSDGTIVKNFESLSLNSSFGNQTVTVANFGIRAWADSQSWNEDDDTLVLDYSKVTAADVEVSVYSSSANARVKNSNTNFSGQGIENFDIKTGIGNDFFSYSPATKSVKLDAGAGVDTLDLSFSNSRTSLNFSFDGINITTNVAGTFLNFEAIAILDSDGDDQISTGAGQDEITSSNGTDLINTGAGNDKVRIQAYGGRQYAVVADAGAGEDVLDLFDFNRSSLEFELMGSNKLDFWSTDEFSLKVRHSIANIEKVLFKDGTYEVKNGALVLVSTTSTPPTPGIKITTTDKSDSISPTAAKNASTANDDTIFTKGGNDSIDGGAGGDAMYGGAGNDTYYIDNTRDKTIEKLNEGTDKVVSSIDWTLAANTETLILQGASAGTGNKLANKITGSSDSNKLSGLAGDDKLKGDAGADWLSGGKGLDTLVGGADADTFHFDKAKLSSADLVKDFARGIDKLEFNASDYGLTAGPLAADMLQIGAKASLGQAQFLFNSKTKELSWDANGKAGGEIKIAKLAGVSLLTVDDFSII
jgi:Ca2+-binding RTX toxin-like protein